MFFRTCFRRRCSTERVKPRCTELQRAPPLNRSTSPGQVTLTTHFSIRLTLGIISKSSTNTLGLVIKRLPVFNFVPFCHISLGHFPSAVIITILACIASPQPLRVSALCSRANTSCCCAPFTLRLTPSCAVPSVSSWWRCWTSIWADTCLS